jgi:hypothetical protein
MINVAIIGTAGRDKTVSKEMTSELFTKMIKKSKDIIENTFHLDPSTVILVSGGAAWSDHIVIKLFMENYISNGLLYLPAQWDSNNKKYAEDTSCGKISNYYHKMFSNKIKTNTLEEIDSCIKNGLMIDVQFPGFFQRNSEIAKSDYLIAFSWSDLDYPTTGGTADTWKKTKTINKIHIPLNNLSI